MDMDPRKPVFVTFLTLLLCVSSVLADDATTGGSIAVTPDGSVSADTTVITIPWPASDIYPMRVGLTWVYGGSPREIAQVVRVVDEEPTEEGSIFTVEGLFGRRAVRVEADGKLMELRGDAWRLLLDLNAEEGATWRIEGDGSDLLDNTDVVVVSRSEAVTVPYSAFGTSVHMTLRSAVESTGVTDAWFVAGVGLVKWVEQSTSGQQTFELLAIRDTGDPSATGDRDSIVVVDPDPGPMPPIVHPPPVDEDDLFPAQVGMSWTYAGSPMEMARSVRIVGEEITADGSLYVWWDGFQGRHAVRKDADGRVLSLRAGEWQMLFDLVANEGTTWTIGKGGEGEDLLDGSTVTVVSRSAQIRVPYGAFEPCVELGLRPDPGLADAGVTRMWFAPGVGLLKWEETTIAGPQTYELVNFAYRWEPSDTTVVEPADSTAARLTGEVLDENGMTVSAAQVTLRPQVSPEISAVGWVQSVWTSRSGTFAFERVEPGAYVVTAMREGYLPAAEQVSLAAGEHRMRLQMRRDAEGEVFLNTNTTVHGSLVAELATPRIEYGSGDSVVVRYRLHNLDEESLTLNFSSGQEYEVHLEGHDGELWKWSEGKLFTQAAVTRQLEAGDTYEFREAFALQEAWAEGGSSCLLRAYLMTGLDASGTDSRSRTEAVVKFATSEGGVVDPVPGGTGRLRAGLRPDRTSYAPGDTAVVEYVLQNVSEAPVSLDFSSAQRYDVVLLGPAGPVWGWSWTRDFAQVTGELVLGPEETYRFRELVPVPELDADVPRSYQLQAFMTATARDSTDVTQKETDAWARFDVRLEEPPIDPNPGPLPYEPRVEAGLETVIDAVGDSVVVNYRLTNKAEEPVQLMYRGGQRYELVLQGAEGDVWRWSDGRGFHDALWEQSLAPHASIDVREAFAMPDVTGLEGKTYVLTAFLAVTPDVDGAISQRETEARLKLTVETQGDLKVEDFASTTDGSSAQRRAADFDDDGEVGFRDFLVFAEAFGTRTGEAEYQAAYDLDSDGAVEFADFLLFASAYGKSAQ